MSARRAVVTFVFWEGYVGSAPSIVNAIRTFEELGFTVELITRETPTGFTAIPEFSPNTTVSVCRPWSSRWARLGLPGCPTTFEQPLADSNGRRASAVRRLKSSIAASIGDLLLAADWFQFRCFVRRATRARARRFWFGVDVIGLIEAHRRAKAGRLGYWSLELIFGERLHRPLLRWFKKLERRASKDAQIVIVQDSGRAALLCAENAISGDRVVLVPNSPRSGDEVSESGFLRQRLNLGSDRTVVLHLGMMGPEVFSTDLAGSVHGWPEGCVLVFHERSARAATDEVVVEAKAAGGDRVFFSLDPVPLDRLPEVVASADVGLVFYNPAKGPNFSVISGASGKLAYYLQAGLPVICLDLPGFAELIGETGCGVCVGSPDEVGPALATVLEGMPRFQRAARRCFATRFAFDFFFSPVVDRVLTALHADR